MTTLAVGVSARGWLRLPWAGVRSPQHRSGTARLEPPGSWHRELATPGAPGAFSVQGVAFLARFSLLRSTARRQQWLTGQGQVRARLSRPTRTWRGRAPHHAARTAPHRPQRTAHREAARWRAPPRRREAAEPSGCVLAFGLTRQSGNRITRRHEVAAATGPRGGRLCLSLAGPPQPMGPVELRLIPLIPANAVGRENMRKIRKAVSTRTSVGPSGGGRGGMPLRGERTCAVAAARRARSRGRAQRARLRARRARPLRLRICPAPDRPARRIPLPFYLHMMP